MLSELKYIPQETGTAELQMMHWLQILEETLHICSCQCIHMHIILHWQQLLISHLAYYYKIIVTLHFTTWKYSPNTIITILSYRTFLKVTISCCFFFECVPAPSPLPKTIVSLLVLLDASEKEYKIIQLTFFHFVLIQGTSQEWLNLIALWILTSVTV